MTPGPVSPSLRTRPRPGRALVAAATALLLTGICSPVSQAQEQTIPAGATSRVALPASNIVATCTPPGSFHPNPTTWTVNPSTVQLGATTGGMPVAGHALEVTVPADHSPAQSITISWSGNTTCVSYNGIVTLRVSPPTAPPSPPPPPGPGSNPCLQPNAWGQDAAARRELDAWEQQLRAAAAELKKASEVLDVFWYLEQIDKRISGPDAGLAKRVGDKLKQADALLKTAEQGVRAADARVRTTRAQIDTIAKTLRAGGTTSKQRQELLAQKARLGRELTNRQKAQSDAHKGLDQLKRSRVGDLAVKLRRYPQLKSLGTTLSRLDKLRGQILTFFKHNPAAKRVARGLSLVGLGSELATYSAWSAEILANLLRELRKPPPGCLAPFEPPVSSTAGAAATLAAATPRYEPAPVAIGELPPAITGGRPPAVATALRNELASITALVPAVRAGLDDRSSDPAARATLKRTLPRLRTALAKAGSLRAKLADALGIAPRTVAPEDLSGYRPQAPSRAALRLLARQGAPPGLRAELRRMFGDRVLPTGRLDPAAALADPALGRLETDLARMLAALG